MKKLYEEYKEILKEKAEENRKEKIKNQFSGWDGSHYSLVRLVKQNMHDDSSFEHVETRFKDMGEYVFVIMKFRGNNAFGAKIINVVTANVSLDNKILSYTYLEQ